MAHKVSGRIVHGGAGLPGVVVKTRWEGSSNSDYAKTMTDQNGVYTLYGLANGLYTITPSLAGYIFSPASQAITISGNDVAGINFTAAP